MTARRTTFLFTALGLLTAALFIADLAVGSVAVPLGDVWAALTGGSCDPVTSDIILKIRLLKAVTALFAGAALAAGGLEMQTLFRNPLAGPYVLGVSSGAGLGVALFLLGAPLLGPLYTWDHADHRRPAGERNHIHNSSHSAYRF